MWKVNLARVAPLSCGSPPDYSLHLVPGLWHASACPDIAIGRRTFERRFKQATSHTVLEYIQRIKIEAPKRQFENSRKNISEVMYDVGYTDTKAFRDLFKKVIGLTPIEYRNKYNKLVADV